MDIEKVAAVFLKFKIQGLLIIGGFEVRNNSLKQYDTLSVKLYDCLSFRINL